MKRGDAMVEDCLVVLFGRIAFVGVPTVMRIDYVLLFHEVVAVGFGEYRGGCYGLVFAVALDDAGEWYSLFVVEAVAIDEEMLRFDRELSDSEIHGMEGSAKDVKAVDVKVVDGGNCPCGCIVFDLRAEQVSLLGGELFRVVEEWVGVVVRKNDSSSINGAGEAATTGFVAAGFDKVSI